MPTATFAAGCFWGVEARFANTPGVTSTAVGYMGGHTQNPTYKEICNKTTGHAEVVQLEFDDQIISYDTLLDIFWQMHDPTTLNRQGPDVGDQYRSEIFYHNDQQRIMAEQSKVVLDKSGIFGNPIVTEITPAAEFWRAEEYHQQYNAKNGHGGCAI
ncbi:peptide-methionine (S)-S-oxide reductase MsrA [Amphritea sp. 2_MG-2023]|jgi:peptide-methionine (S)-S-oxide reductase|uniref:peptide-methionine (S)-S-oxide reductase MsrA n=1 Tax=Amphritea TaxID=515417 RepID=UPI001C07E67F|nr:MULTISPECIES: peptide-methionine (S)-S-oxide reductase MsrA [Amphritea]MBU2966143.1 peptide-methionine (S)-S-oxide reductase MsrA [Amphritea atlantica]MDO6418202.1 peptide-methionine (S)-S-oxide reductase MsrA [Amphritea sp. 2_MG-2023]MDX2422724.1 peptide-methionine (S)-S-oxide reductase MsrA [Amphritea sp.]